MKEALERFPEEVALHFYLAEQLYETKEWPRSRLHFLYVLHHYDQAGWRGSVFRNIALWRLTNIFFTEGKLDAARTYLEDYLRHNPASHSGRAFLALRILYPLGRFKESQQELQTLVRDEEHWQKDENFQPVEVFARLGALLLLHGDPAAMSFLDRALAIKPELADVQGLRHFARREMREALKSLWPVIRAGDKDLLLRLHMIIALEAVDNKAEVLAQEYRSLAQRFESVGDYERAYALFEHSNNLEYSQEVRFDLARLERKRKKPAEALQILRHLRPGNSLQKYMLRLEQLEVRLLDQNDSTALTELEQLTFVSLEKEELAQVEYGRAMLAARWHLQQGASLAGLLAVERALQWKDTPQVRFFRSFFLYDLDRKEEQLVELRGLVARGADWPDLSNALGYTLLELGHFSAARPFIEKALSAEPTSAAYQDSMGWLYFKEGQWNQSMFHLQLARALSGKRQNPEILLHLADVHIARQDLRLALARLEDARRRDAEEKGRLAANIGERIKMLEILGVE
ncbi:MAG: hypothetical protein HS115_03830 [Spirochaetales bacterium]|nr:hypothetical protein [Spirochaetales bacterium]